MAATLTANGVNFSDGSTINGTTSGAIGSYALFWLSQTTSYTFGSNMNGSYLFYISAVSGAYDGWAPAATTATLSQIPANRTTAYTYTPGGGIYVTFTPIGGTWRAIGFAPRATSGCCTGNMRAVLCVRVA